MAKVLYLFFFLIAIKATLGMKCYVCTMSAAETSDECVTNPAGVTAGASSIECPMKYCTVKRQEYKNPAGKVASFYRGCENNPIHLNTMVEDDDFKTYFRACTANLCNIGNGVQSVSNGNLGGGSGITSLKVPGRGNSNSNSNVTSRSSLLIITLFSILAIYMGTP